MFWVLQQEAQLAQPADNGTPKAPIGRGASKAPTVKSADTQVVENNQSSPPKEKAKADALDHKDKLQKPVTSMITTAVMKPQNASVLEAKPLHGREKWAAAISKRSVDPKPLSKPQPSLPSECFFTVFAFPSPTSRSRSSACLLLFRWGLKKHSECSKTQQSGRFRHCQSRAATKQRRCC